MEKAEKASKTKGAEMHGTGDSCYACAAVGADAEKEKHDGLIGGDRRSVVGGGWAGGGWLELAVFFWREVGSQPARSLARLPATYDDDVTFE